MNPIIHINPKYLHLKDFILNIPAQFYEMGTPIHTGRNELRLVETENVKIVIKHFKRITEINRFIYANFRKSKGRRSFEHSMQLIEKGFASPEPVAYINLIKGGILTDDYYICLYCDFRPFKELLSKPLAEAQKGLEEYAKYTYKLHKCGIFHKDYSTSNILFNDNGGNYEFSLIDDNRLLFRSYSRTRSMVTMVKRQDISVEQMGIIAGSYARAAGENEYRILNNMTRQVLIISKVFSVRRRIKKSLKAIKVKM